MTTPRRIFNAAVGFLTGLITSPLAAIAWPFVLASFLWNETDEDFEGFDSGERSGK